VLSLATTGTVLHDLLFVWPILWMPGSRSSFLSFQLEPFLSTKDKVKIHYTVSLSSNLLQCGVVWSWRVLSWCACATCATMPTHAANGAVSRVSLLHEATVVRTVQSERGNFAQ